MSLQQGPPYVSIAAPRDPVTPWYRWNGVIALAVTGALWGLMLAARTSGGVAMALGVATFTAAIVAAFFGVFGIYGYTHRARGMVVLVLAIAINPVTVLFIAIAAAGGIAD